MYKTQLLWEEAKKEKKLAGKLKLSFQLGLLNGFRRKLDAAAEAAQASADGNDEGLILLVNRSARAYRDRLYPSLSSRQKTQRRIDQNVYTAGREAGSQLRVDVALGGRSEKSDSPGTGQLNGG